MTIGIIVESPQTAEEEKYFIPVATEYIFSHFWMKGSQDLNLQWLPIFSTGICIEKGDVHAIINELEQLKKWAGLNIHDQNTSQDIMRRIDYIIHELPHAFKREGLVLYIG